MSELEKTRAITFLSLLGATLIVLFALRSEFDPNTRHAVDPLQLCAVTKGAFCDGLEQPGTRDAANVQVVELGAMVVTAPRVSTVADLGSMTITAPRTAVAQVRQSAGGRVSLEAAI